MIFIIGISTFVCISLGLLGIYWLLYKPQSAATERLRRLGSKEVDAGVQNIESAVLPDERPVAEIADSGDWATCTPSRYSVSVRVEATIVAAT